MIKAKKVMMLRKESEARAKAEERLKEVVDARASIEQKYTTQVERKLQTQQIRFGDLIQKIEAQVNEEIAKANEQLQELLEKINSYKAEVEQKNEKLNKAQQQLKAEKAEKIKAYESLWVERYQRKEAQSKLAGDITEVQSIAEAESIRLKEYRKIKVLSTDIINDYKFNYQYCIHQGHLKRNIALLSALALISVVTLVLIVGKFPFVSKSGLELTREPVLATASMGSNIAAEKPSENNAAGLLRGSIGGPVTSTRKPVLKPKIEDKAGLQITEEKNIISSSNQQTIKEERKFPKIITSANSHIVQSSDDDRWEISIGSHVSYAFSEVSIPTEATIKSVVIFIEHCEEERFIEDRLEWMVGTGWPDKPEVWTAIKAPIHRGESNENVDTWDVTGVVDTVEKIKALQLHVKNNSYSYKSKALMDYAYVVVEYD